MSRRAKLYASILSVGTFSLVVLGCGSSSEPEGTLLGTLPQDGATGSAATSALAGTTATADANKGGAGAKQSAASGGAGAAKAGAKAAGAGGKVAVTGKGAGGVIGGTTKPNTGPEDGDPSKPMVSIPGVTCGNASLMALQTVKITDRDVVVAYPCAHEGAPVTFFLFLHGTVDEPMKVTFTMNAWAIHNLVDSHNVIVVAPKAIGTQWGNGDEGKDLPHLYDVVDWVYNTFGKKFDIRSMWAQGGSWGAFYLSTVFACDPKFQDRLRGIQLVVGGGCPSCSNRLSCVVAQEELEKGGGNPLTAEQKEGYASGAAIDTYATTHGCDGKKGPVALGNAQAWDWPNCDKGWVHSYYMGPGNHADAWDPAVVKKATDDIKATEK